MNAVCPLDSAGSAMFRRRGWVVCIVTVAVCGLYAAAPRLFAAQASVGTPAAPAVIILLADDLGAGELGCQGNPQIPTPQIDSLAANGCRFTQAYVCAPNCSPSRAGLLTGRIPTRFGYEFNPIGATNAQPGVGLPASEVTLANVLRDAGYATAAIGKWHLGGTAEFHPARRGFDYFYGFLHEGHFFGEWPWEGLTSFLRRKTLPAGHASMFTQGAVTWSTHVGSNEPPYDADNPLLRMSQPVAIHKYLTEQLTDEAIGFVSRHRHQPFLLYLAYNAVHSPMQAQTADVERFAQLNHLQRQVFAGMLTSLDVQVGRLLEAVRSEVADRDVLVFFLSDNGGPTRELTSSNLPYRGEKGSMYEGGLRVPFLWRWDGQVPAGSTCDLPISATDIFTTCCQAAGVAVPPRVDGVDLLSFVRQEVAAGTRPHAEFYWRQGPRAAMRMGDWKAVRTSSRSSQPQWELFDLAQDESETRDLATEEPSRLQQLRTRFEELDAEMIEPRFR